MSISDSYYPDEGVDSAILHAYQAMWAEGLEEESAVDTGIVPIEEPHGEAKQITTSPSRRRSSVLQRQAPARLTSHLPPLNFGAVIPGTVYRSSFPLPKNFSFLKSLKLKTILTLVSEPYPEPYVGFLKDSGIRQIIITLPANKGIVRVETTTMLQALGVILDRENHPLLIHCNKGKHRTGCVVSCFRKLQGEDINSALNEYHTYAGMKARSLDVDFIESFDERSLLWMARENGFLPADEPLVDSPGVGNMKMKSRARG